MREYAGLDGEGERLYVDDIVILYGYRLFHIVAAEEYVDGKDISFFLDLTELETFNQDGHWSTETIFYTPEKLLQLQLES